MVFDVDKLKEALDEIRSLSLVDSVTNRWLSRPPTQAVFAAARLVVAGQPLWWCQEHKEWPLPEGDWSGECRYSRVDYAGDCRMVEGWWMPTGKDETP